MKNIMKRAWEIYRTLTGDRIAKLSAALKMAWAEIKNAVKAAFTGFASVASVEKRENASDVCHYLTFKAWEKNGIRRIYINDYKRRTLGFIENGTVTIENKQGNSQSDIDFAVNNFKTVYNF